MNSSARRLILSFCIVIAIAFAASRLLAQDITHDAVPGKWVESFEPERMPPLAYPAYFTDLEKARTQAFAGRYKVALMTLYKIKDPKPADLPEIAVIRGTSLAAIGQKTEALDVLSKPDVADDPHVKVLRANVLMELGRESEAIALLKEIVAKHADFIPARFYLGSALENTGQTQAAIDAYAWFVPFIDKWQGQGAEAFSSAEDVTLIGRGLDRWASLSGEYKTRTALNDIIYNMFIKAYDEIDRGYWPAHLAAGQYALSHNDADTALKELAAAHQGNPRDIQTMALAGQIMLGQFNFDGCESWIAAIQDVDDSSIDAELLLCRDLMAQRRAREAMLPAQRVLARQPHNIEALGLLAASEALQLHADKVAEILKQIDAIQPNNASGRLEVAGQLAARRQYPQAEAMYLQAIQRAPNWTEAYNGLGLLYTQSGDEDKSTQILTRARILDPYNIATTNYMRLLAVLHNMAHVESSQHHFVIYYDAQQDPVIPEYFGDYLESVYQAICTEYHQEPPVKTQIEVFPTHADFSVRTTGSPWIGTVGASTGSVIALVSPRKGLKTMGTFNWAQVLRHEFTHTVTLAATDNRIAHWLTEGLAVSEEHSPIRWEWVPMLYQAVSQHQLFTMDNLTWGFIRPKRPIDRQLAYAESFWICQYIEQTYGHEKILAMLAEFRKGKEQDEVFPLILGVPMSKFQDDFFAWCDKQVASWGYDKATSLRYQVLVNQGEAQIQSRDWKDAIKTYEEVAKIRPVDALPHQRLAGLYLLPAVKDMHKAAEQLEILDKVSLYDNMYSKKLARVYRDAGDIPAAVDYARKAVYIDPYDKQAHELYAGILEKAGNDPKDLEREQRVIGILDNMAKAPPAPTAAQPAAPN